MSNNTLHVTLNRMSMYKAKTLQLMKRLKHTFLFAVNRHLWPLTWRPAAFLYFRHDFLCAVRVCVCVCACVCGHCWSPAVCSCMSSDVPQRRCETLHSKQQLREQMCHVSTLSWLLLSDWEQWRGVVCNFQSLALSSSTANITAAAISLQG